MFDESVYERASYLEQAEIDHALARHRADRAARVPGGDTCRVCGDPIPLARRQAIDTDLCVACARELERERRS